MSQDEASQRIRQAIKENNVHTLRILARADGGLVQDSSRRKACRWTPLPPLTQGHYSSA